MTVLVLAWVGAIAGVVSVVGLFYSRSRVFRRFVFYAYENLDARIGAHDSVRLYASTADLPKRYGIKRTLERLANRGGRLVIVARTAKNWLDTEGLKLLETAVRDDVRVAFVLQDPSIRVPSHDEDDEALLAQQVWDSMAAFEKLLTSLVEPELQSRCTLHLIDDVIESSVVLEEKSDQRARDIRMDLGQSFERRATLVFKRLKPDTENYLRLELVERIMQSPMLLPLAEFRRLEAEADQKKHALLSKFAEHSAQRADSSERLAPLAASVWLAANEPESSGPPPVSVQLLLTNECSTDCVMCDHRKLAASAGRELSFNEVSSVLENISDLGCRNVVLSGGEPLCREDLPEILGKAKDLGLNIGLLTNGLMPNHEPVTEDFAKLICDTCSWVQVSIDAFTPDAYRRVRGVDCLDEVAVSALRLFDAASGTASVEVCYTIQTGNAHEAPHLEKYAKKLLPRRGLNVRLKVAHGVEGDDHLCDAGTLEEILAVLPDSERFNTRYLNKMNTEKYLDLDGAAVGRPLAQRLADDRKLNKKCWAMRLTCKIDAFGDVYPCCFLFDDNRADSDFREIYKIGSMRVGATAISSEGVNVLGDIWNGQVLEHLRSHKLPVNESACSRCTRHYYHNDFLHELEQLFSEYRRQGLAQQMVSSNQGSDFWV